MSSSETNITANETETESEIPDAPLKTSTPKHSVSANPPINATPRAGGYMKVLPSASNVMSSQSSKSMNQTKSHASMSVFYAKSRERRINLVLEESEWGFGESQLDICNTDTLADNMLAVTISCVMLMAADVADISEEYFIFAENYLSCIKDDSDYHPPNVQGILNHIAYLRETTNRKRDLTKENCKCVAMEGRAGCDATECAKRSTSKVKFKKMLSNSIKKSRCRIPVRQKSYSPTI